MPFISGLFARKSSRKLSLPGKKIIKSAFTKNRIKTREVHKKILFTEPLSKLTFQNRKKSLYTLVISSAP